MNARELVTVTDKREQAIRDAITEFVMVGRASSDNCSVHIPKDAVDADADALAPLCERTVAKRNPNENIQHAAKWKRKPTAVYPPGHKPICRYCATRWADDE